MQQRQTTSTDAAPSLRPRRMLAFALTALLTLSGCQDDTKRRPTAGDSSRPVAVEAGKILRSDANGVAITVGPAGGTVIGPDGVVLHVPARGVDTVTTASIQRVATGYDIHIAGEWTGTVGIAVPRPLLKASEGSVLAHYTANGVVFEPNVVVGNFMVARVASLSVVDDLKCLKKVLPTNVLKCIGRKEVTKKIAKAGGKKIADEIDCGDVLDVIGTVFQDEACHVGETDEDIQAARDVYAEQEANAQARPQAGPTNPTADDCPGGDYSESRADGTCGTPPRPVDSCAYGDYSGSRTDGTCGSAPPATDNCPNRDYSGSRTDGTCGTQSRTVDSCPGGDFSDSNTDGTCGSPPVQPSVSVSWGSRAAPNYCGGDTSCTYVTVSWSNFSGGDHTLTPYFDGQGDWCAGTSCSSSRIASGSSGAFSGYWAVGYCQQGHTITATVDGVSSGNSINSVDHGC
jgi:hypothetical protein